MSQHRETATDRLVSIIQLIQMGRRSGVLTAKRGEGIIQEEGTITFVKGKVTQANVGRRSGSEALNTLTTWGSCRFIFASSEDTNASVSPLTSPSIASPARTPGDTDPSLRLQPLPPTTPGGRRTEPLPTAGEDTTGFKKDKLPASAPTAPYRLWQMDPALHLMESRGFSRAHRHLFLLVDGQRTVAELVRLMGRNQNEVYELLRDLAQAGVIQLPGTSPYR